MVRVGLVLVKIVCHDLKLPKQRLTSCCSSGFLSSTLIVRDINTVIREGWPTIPSSWKRQSARSSSERQSEVISVNFNKFLMRFSDTGKTAAGHHIPASEQLLRPPRHWHGQDISLGLITDHSTGIEWNSSNKKCFFFLITVWVSVARFSDELYAVFL